MCTSKLQRLSRLFRVTFSQDGVSLNLQNNLRRALLGLIRMAAGLCNARRCWRLSFLFNVAGTVNQETL